MKKLLNFMKLAPLLSAFIFLIGQVSASTISVNFTEEKAIGVLAATTTAGIDKQANWNNVTAKTGKKTSLKDSQGTSVATILEWTAPLMWQDALASTDAAKKSGNAQLAYSYLDDTAEQGPSFTLTGVPYKSYTLILYLSNDVEGSKYGSINVNGSDFSTDGNKSRYTSQRKWDASNTVTVNKLKGDLVVKGSNRNLNIRCCIAGFQVIDTSGTPHSSALLNLGGITISLEKE